jgi:glycosyltransferase involved in cell wall biosynthesis
MRIVMLTRLFEPHIGGVETHVKEVAIEALLDGNKVDIVTSEHDSAVSVGKSRYIDGFPTGADPDNVTIYRIPNLHENISQTFFTRILERYRVWSWMVEHLSLFFQADVIHIHDVFWWYWPIKLLLPHKKVFMTFHGFEAGKLPTRKAVRARKIAERLTRGNICIGSWIQKWYGTKPTVVLYGGTRCEARSVKKTGKKIRAVFIGRLQEDTGILEYIEAVKHVKDLSLDIYGEGLLKGKIMKMISSSSNISYKGVTTDVCSVLNAYDVAFASSYLSMLNAMKTKTLVAAFATDQLKEDYLHAHPMFSSLLYSQSVKELQSQLEHLKPSLVESMTQTAYAWAQKQTWKAVYQYYKILWNS